MLALVTGASKGIGNAIAKALANEGIDLVINSRSIHDLELLKTEILTLHPNLHIDIFRADLSVANEVDDLIDFIIQKNLYLDILVNNAGIYQPGMIIDGPDGFLEQMMNTNFYSIFRLTRGLLPKLIRQKSGYIFNMCSVAGLDPYPGGSLYCISKFALQGFSRCLREELKSTGIKVSTIYPGATWSDSWKGVNLPMERLMQANDVAQVIISSLKMSPSAVMEEIILRPQLGDL